MAKNWNYRPAGYEFDDCNSDDDFFAFEDHSATAGSAAVCQQPAESNCTDETTAVDAKNGLQTDISCDSEAFGFGFYWGLRERHADPVVQLQSKSFSSLIFLNDFKGAAVRNDVKVIEEFLRNGVNVDSRLSSGWTALMHAAYSASCDAVQCLLERGADPKANKDGLTVLMIACGSISRNHSNVLNCVNQLLDKGVSVNTYNRSHRSPLMLAARSGHAAVVQTLLEHHADVDEQDNLGYSALMLAAEKGHAEVVKTLLKAGADVKKQTDDGDDAANLAFLRKHKTVQLMLENCQSETMADVSNREPAQVKETSGGHWSASKLPEASSYTFSNMDLFLTGLGLSELIPVFQAKNVSFNRFLRLTDDNLIEMGIHQLGMRKRILDNLRDAHKRNWETSSLTPIDYNRKITCMDSASVVANIHFHARYIASTIGYMSDHVAADSSIISNAPAKEVEDLCINVEETITNVKHIYEELNTLKTRLGKICLHHDFSPPDLVKAVKSEKRSPRRRRMVATAAALCGLLTVSWLNRDAIVSGIQRLLSELNFG